VDGIATQSWALTEVDGELLAATNDGVFRILGRQVQLVSPVKARALHPSRVDPGRVWVGTVDGLAAVRVASGRVVDDGHVTGVNDHVRSIGETPDGTLWLGVLYQGLLRVRPAAVGDAAAGVQAFTEGEGLPLGYGRARVFTVGDEVLVATDRGVLRVNAQRGDLASAADVNQVFGVGRWVSEMCDGPDGSLWLVSGPEKTVSRAVRDTMGDYRELESSFRPLPARTVWVVVAEDHQVLWIGTSNGLLRSQHQVPEPEPEQVRCLVRSVRTLDNGAAVYGGTSLAAGPLREVIGPRLEYATNDLRLEFASPCFGAEAETEYRTFLEGFDGGWSPWSQEVRRDYTNLPEGDYRFLVHARRLGGFESVEAAFSYTIRPPLHRTWWAYAAYVLGTGLLIVGIVGFWTDRAHRAAQREAAHQWRVDELRRARGIQRNMLPSSPPRIDYLDIAAEQRTATEVGGDYYDFFPQDDGRLFLAVGDATGHGLAAGIMVTSTRTALLTIQEPHLPTVAAKLNRVLRRVHLGRRLNMALTLVGLRPDVARGRVSVEASGGGMAPLYVLRSSGDVEERIVGGIPLGALDDPKYCLVELELEPYDALVMMSDGVPETANRDRGELGYDGVTALLAQLAVRYAEGGTKLTADDILADVLGTCGRWVEPGNFEDDVTVVVIRVLPMS